MENLLGKRPEAVIFDLDGVIVDTEPLSQKHEREFLIKLGVEPRRLDVNLQGLNAKAYFMTLKTVYGLEQPVDELINLDDPAIWLTCRHWTFRLSAVSRNWYSTWPSQATS